MNCLSNANPVHVWSWQYLHLEKELAHLMYCLSIYIQTAILVCQSYIKNGPRSFRPWVVSPVSRFARGSLRPWSFRPWVVSPLFGGSFRPCFLLKHQGLSQAMFGDIYGGLDFPTIILGECGFGGQGVLIHTGENPLLMRNVHRF